MKNNDYILTLNNISKSFSGVLVLDNVNIKLKNKSVHAIVGGNGAGKSTLMKILDGFYTPASGSIIIDNKNYVFKNPAHAHSMGIYLVPQEPRLFPHMSILENMEIGYDGSRKEVKNKAQELIEELNCNFRLEDKAENLPIAGQQLVEIIKGLIRDAKVLIFDEPTSALSFSETKELFSAIKKILNRPRIGVFYITHRLRELTDIADYVTILNDGKVVTEGPIGNFTIDLIIKYMVPEVKKESEEKRPIRAAKKKNNLENEKGQAGKTSRVIYEVKNLTGDRFKDISFKLYRGEILGIAGVIGAGRTELAETLFGIRNKLSGEIYLEGEKFDPKTPRDNIKKGIMYIPEDRHLNGIFQIASVTDNITSSILFKLAPIFTNQKREDKLANTFINKLGIRVKSSSDKLNSLSGGNQQKVVVSKALAVEPKVIIMDEPTRGIDSNARKDLYQLIEELGDEGVGMIIISSDIDEIVELCDRVIVLHLGEIVDEVSNNEINFDRIISSSFGVKK